MTAVGFMRDCALGATVMVVAAKENVTAVEVLAVTLTEEVMAEVER
jgi:hypothetical protein